MNRLLVLASAVLACAMPAEDNTRPPPPPPPPRLGGQDTILIAGHALYVPRGFTVNLFVEGLNGVRYLALGPGGAVYASLPGAGRIVRLVDANGDSVADRHAAARRDRQRHRRHPHAAARRADRSALGVRQQRRAVLSARGHDHTAHLGVGPAERRPRDPHARDRPRQLHVCGGRLVVQRVRRAGGRLDARGGHAVQPGRVRRAHLRPGAPQLSGPRLSPHHR